MSNVVSFSPIKKGFQKKVERKTMDITYFLRMPSIPVQRDTEGRANTNAVKKMLKTLQPEHVEVAVGVLKNPCVYQGHAYKRGHTFVINGNTRQYFWNNCIQGVEPKSDAIPETVEATVYLCEDMDEGVRIYHSYDSADATEKKMQKLYGMFRLFDFEPKSSKLQTGSVLSALNIASFYYDKKRINQSGVKVEDLPYIVKLWLPAIKVWDDVTKNPKNWDSALFAAIIMALMKHGYHNPKLLEIIDAIDNRKSNTESHKRTGRTHIVEEWKMGVTFPNKGTGWEKPGGLKECVSFILYWIEKDIANEKLSQLGFNWRQTAEHYFDYIKTVDSVLEFEDQNEGNSG